MGNKMLIDAAHPEETRVVVLRGNRIEEFDFEAANRKQLRGNIYLAKVTRVEPSLQAAFVEYGGNRHGFLAFSEIHPDYYQIPQADRAALLSAEAEEETAASVEDEAAAEESVETAASEEAAPEPADETEEADATSAETDSAEDDEDEDGEEEETVESLGNEDALEEIPQRKPARARSYKIQEVIKRRQILLVQVVKEERGNKGAALTTYLSLAGRYSVLMPNTARGGGISRKITNATDRKRLKTIAGDLEVPQGMGVILRTAGANRTKTEIKRDFEYLMRLWENVRDFTLKSAAPSLVYEEGSLIKRAIRDLYNRDIDQVLVAGEDGYREAKDFMRMLMPSHAKNVQPYREAKPLFARAGIEEQLDSMVTPTVTLKSGGYLVINQTEALVSIDVNSGRSTREHSIEDTALHTNLEAAEEVSRQLRLRDLAGLIVIDFIDMEEKRNNRAVERRLKECLKADRARIQVGRISHFGLLEMSRQRIRSSVLESTMDPCPHCGGTGHVRSSSSVALQILRAVEEILQRSAGYNIIVRMRSSVALYILNQKRQSLSELEARFGPSILIEIDETLSGQPFQIGRGEPYTGPIPERQMVQPDSIAFEEEDDVDDIVEEEEEDDIEVEVEAEAETETRSDEGRNGRRRKRRRRGRGGRDEARADTARQDREDAGEEEADEDAAAEASETGADVEESGEDRGEGRRRRGRRGGRRRRGRRDGTGEAQGADAQEETDQDEDSFVQDDLVSADSDVEAEVPEADVEQADLAMEASSTDAADAPLDAPYEAAQEPVPAEDAEAVAETGEETPSIATPSLVEEPVISDEAVAVEEPVAAETSEETTASEETEEEVDDNRPKRSGWWQRRSFF